MFLRVVALGLLVPGTVYAKTVTYEISIGVRDLREVTVYQYDARTKALDPVPLIAGDGTDVDVLVGTGHGRELRLRRTEHELVPVGFESSGKVFDYGHVGWTCGAPSGESCFTLTDPIEYAFRVDIETTADAAYQTTEYISLRAAIPKESLAYVRVTERGKNASKDVHTYLVGDREAEVSVLLPPDLQVPPGGFKVGDAIEYLYMGSEWYAGVVSDVYGRGYEVDGDRFYDHRQVRTPRPPG